MRWTKFAGFLVCLMLFAAPPAFAQGKYGSKAEAQAMAEKAAALYKAEGAKALAQFQDKSGPYFDRDLYVFVIDKDGVFLAHGSKPALVNKNSIALKDATGFEFMKAFLAVKDKGWVDYKWGDPTDNNKVKDKSSYIVRVGDDVVGVGYYKNQ